MSAWSIDGTIESAEAGRSGWAQMIFQSILFRTDDGEAIEHRKLVAGHDLGDAIEPGMAGRFYLYKAGDQKGVYAVRAANGETLYAFPNLATWIFAVCLFVSGPIFFINWSEDGLASLYTLTALVAALIGAVMLPLQLRARMAAKSLFDADDGFESPSESMTIP